MFLLEPHDAYMVCCSSCRSGVSRYSLKQRCHLCDIGKDISLAGTFFYHWHDWWKMSTIATHILLLYSLLSQPDPYQTNTLHGPLTRYLKLPVARAPGTFSHHRGLAIPTYIMACARRMCRDACRDRELMVSSEVGEGENVPGTCATRNFTYLARGPWCCCHIGNVPTLFRCNDMVIRFCRGIVPHSSYGLWYPCSGKYIV